MAIHCPQWLGAPSSGFRADHDDLTGAIVDIPIIVPKNIYNVKTGLFEEQCKLIPERVSHVHWHDPFSDKITRRGNFLKP